MRCLLTRSWRPRPHWCKLQEQQGWVGFLVPVHPPWMTRHRSCNPADRPNNSSLSVVDQPISSAHARIHAWDPTIAAECSFQTDLHFAEIFPGNRSNPALDSVVFEPWRFCLTPPVCQVKSLKTNELWNYVWTQNQQIHKSFNILTLLLLVKFLKPLASDYGGAKQLATKSNNLWKSRVPFTLKSRVFLTSPVISRTWM